MTPLLFKSVTAWLNNSKDKGSSVFEPNFSDVSNQWGIFVIVEGLSVAI